MGVADRVSGPWRPWAVTAAGVAMSVLVAVLVAAIEAMTGFNVFGFSVWVVLPVGAYLTGIAAASGFYFGSLYLHTRAGWVVAAQMVLVAALTNFVIYYLEYLTFSVSGKAVHESIGFLDFEKVFFTHQQLRVGRGMVPTGPIGDFGYWLAFFDFMGFLAGGLTLFVILQQHPACKTCPRYLHTRATKQRYFSDAQEASTYYDGLFDRPLNDPLFANQATLGRRKALSSDTVLIQTKIMECPECSRQTWSDEVNINNGREWKEAVELTRKMALPLGTNAVPFLRATLS